MSDEDEELKRIREKKLQDIKNRALQEERKPAVNTPIELVDATFSEVVEGNPTVVVDCWAPWCAPCHIVAPVLEELAKDYSGKILFGKLNVDENPKTAAQYQIMSIPTLLVFKSGRLVDRIIGAMPREMLEPKIARHL